MSIFGLIDARMSAYQREQSVTIGRKSVPAHLHSTVKWSIPDIAQLPML